MYVHPDAGLVYLANPRTASRSTAYALEGIGFRMVGSHHSGPNGEEDGALYFTTVRELWATIESWARYLDVGPDQVLEHMDLTNQWGIVPGWLSWTLFPHAEAADVLLRFGYLQEDLNRLLEEHDLPTVELPHIGATPEWPNDLARAR